TGMSHRLWSVPATTGNSNAIRAYADSATAIKLAFYGDDGVAIAPQQTTTNNAYHTFGSYWTTSQAAAISDGVRGSFTSTDANSSLYANAYIGSRWLSGPNFYDFWNSSISRLTVYPSALSDSDIISVTNAIKDGP
ncbi:MAG: hypothetical protein WCK26_03920, partial [Candidatus Saccharibacteria bacterium]